MNKIGNIVTTEKKPKYSKLFNVVSSYDSICKDLPTLIIGLDNAKKCIDNIDILKKRYGDVYWTFSKTERRCDYEEDVIHFYDVCIKSRMNKVKYTYINPITYSFGMILRVARFLKGPLHKTIFLTKDSKFMFVYCAEYDTVFGISLTFAEYFGIEKKRIYKLLNNSEFIHDTSFINNDLRRIMSANTHYILPLYEYFRE